MCLKPAPRSSMGCKFYGRFFFSSRKIWSVVCRLVDHSIGLFIIFRKISRPVYERENVTPVQNFRIKGHFCHRLKKKNNSVHKMTLLSHWSFDSSNITIWTLKGQFCQCQKYQMTVLSQHKVVFITRSTTDPYFMLNRLISFLKITCKYFSSFWSVCPGSISLSNLDFLVWRKKTRTQ